ncbi:QueT transporter family protein [Candidatus Bathyarchaeota archaeon]|nr:MAG: QueT transporter family protein [Candidatus Bathyarchaeota archaeon]
MDSKEISLGAVFAALYAVLLIVLAPISFGPVQLRVADCLIPLAALLGWPVIWGVTLGCFVGNTVGGIIAFSSVNPVDIIFGSVANLAASYMIFKLRRKCLLGCIIGSIIIGMIVGGYLWMFTPSPSIGGLSLPAWAAMIISLTISSLVAVAVIGYALLLALTRPSVIGSIRSMGLKVYV